MLTATIIVVAILTILIFSLSIIAFHSFLKAERQEIVSGSRDNELREAVEKEKKKSSKITNITAAIISGIVALIIVVSSITAIIYRSSGNQIMIGNQTSLVIVSNSMDGFYDEKYELTLPEDAEKDQFQVGDLLQFEKVGSDDELVLFDVYGYKAKNGKTITHRYIGTTEDGRYIFRGDNTGGRDSYVEREQVILHYTDIRIPRIGFFILFTQSGFGLYSFISILGVYIITDIYALKYDKLVKSRVKELDFELANEIECDRVPEEDIKENQVSEKVDNSVVSNDEVINSEVEQIHEQLEVATEEVSQKQIILSIPKKRKYTKHQKKINLVEFDTKDGKHVKFYVKK